MANPGLLAVKTINLIEEMIRADQGAAYRGHLGKIIPEMKDAYRSEPETFRSHLGASLVGTKCARAIWYGFHWATKSDFSGRILRLFNRGHLEEARFIAMLQTIGVHVVQADENGNQYRISGANGHYGGSGDGVAFGIPDLSPGMWALLEFKTHNDASFKKLKEDGVRSAKFEHYVQMQQYMKKMGLGASLYMAVNKNTDELYGEIIPLDTPVADQFIDRGEKIVWLKRAPEKLGNPPSPGNFDCKWCDHRPICFLGATPPVNCRTCSYATPLDTGNGEWGCTNPMFQVSAFSNSPMVLEKSVQLTGCAHWAKHPDIG